MKGDRIEMGGCAWWWVSVTAIDCELEGPSLTNMSVARSAHSGEFDKDQDSKVLWIVSGMWGADTGTGEAGCCSVSSATS